MKKVIGRDIETRYIEQAELFEESILVQGKKGVGKTFLISHYEVKNKKNFLWVSIDKFRSLEDIVNLEIQTHGLTSPEISSVELLLKIFSKTWSEYDGVVWENFQFLSSSYKKILINFATSSHKFPTQFFTSTENEETFVKNHCKIIPLESFTLDETRLYLENIKITNKEHAAIDVESVFQETKGIPKLLNIYILSDGDISSYWRNQVETLSEQQQELIITLLLINRPVKLSELNFLEVSIEDISFLNSLLLIEYFQNDNDYIKSNFSLSNIEDSFNSDVIFRIRNNLVDTLIESNKVSAEIIYHVLLTRNTDTINSYLEKNTDFFLPSLESQSAIFLNDFCDLCADTITEVKSSDLVIIILLRYLSKSLFLLGRRSDALSYLNNYFSENKDYSKYKDQAKFLMIEYVQQLNRMDDFEQALSLSRKLIPYTKETMNILLRIEQNTALMNIDIDESYKLFNSLYSDTKNYKDDSYDYYFAMGQLNFQYARCLYNLEQMDKAQDAFSRAAQYFQKISKPYFATVCDLNLIWVLIKKLDYDQIRVKSSSVLEYCHSFGYHYISAGINVILAKVDRHHLQLNEALEKINLSLGQLGNDAPFLPYKDATIEKIRILLHLGFRNDARSLLDELSQRGEKHKVTELDDYKKVKLEIDIYNYDSLEEKEAWSQVSYDEYEEDHKSLYLFQLGEELDVHENSLSNPLSKVMFFIGQIYKSMMKGSKSEVWSYISKVEKLFDGCSIANEYFYYYRIVSLLVSIEKEERKQRQNILRSFFNEIKDSCLSKEIKDIFEVTIENLISTNSKSWTKISKRDQYRYKLIVNSFTDKTEGKYYLIDGLSKKLVPDYKVDENLDFVFIDDIGELYYKGELVAGFTGRKKLQDFLGAFFEISPREIGKVEIVPLIWGEIYDPFKHDSRVYTNIQRLKSALKVKDLLIKGEDGYSWNSKYSFNYYKRRVDKETQIDNRNQSLLIKIFLRFRKKEEEYLSRKMLVEASGISESQVKRELSSLLEKGLLVQTGKGRSVKYMLTI
ncbi:hypothetical protein [Halobacteriovorax sp.]|uniref:hypothetical protein n=1 Tax=Halobacteriovorax sp. TaxID=2020862 RepID=UPI0035616915